MATIINNPGSGDADNGAGWVVPVIVLILVLLIAYFAYGHFGGHRAAAPSANVNVTLPSGGSGGGSGGSGGGTTGGGAGGGTAQ